MLNKSAVRLSNEHLSLEIPLLGINNSSLYQTSTFNYIKVFTFLEKKIESCVNYLWPLKINARPQRIFFEFLLPFFQLCFKLCSPSSYVLTDPFKTFENILTKGQIRMRRCFITGARIKNK